MTFGIQVGFAVKCQCEIEIWNANQISNPNLNYISFVDRFPDTYMHKVLWGRCV